MLLPLWREVERLHGRVARGFFRGGERPDDFCPPELRPGALRGAADQVLLVVEVVEEEGRVVGAVHALLRDTPRSPSLLPRRRLYVETLVVDPRHRRRGLGRRLLDEAERWGRQRGAEQVLLTAWLGNQEALDFYRALGFAPVSQVLAREL